jgi:hypothetical protein
MGASREAAGGKGYGKLTCASLSAMMNTDQMSVRAANRETVAASVELRFRATLEMKVCGKKRWKKMAHAWEM